MFRPDVRSSAQPSVNRPTTQRPSVQTAKYLSQIALAEEAHRAPRHQVLRPRPQVDEARALKRQDRHFDNFERVYAAREAARESGIPWASDAPTYVSNGTARTARTGMSRGSRGNSGDEWRVGDPILMLPLERRKILMRMYGLREVITLLMNEVDETTRKQVQEIMRVEMSQNRSMADSIYKALMRKGKETGNDEVGMFVNQCKEANVCRHGTDCQFFARGCCIANHPPPKTPAKKSQKAPPAGKEKK